MSEGVLDPAGGSGDLLRVIEILAERVGTEFDPQRGWSAIDQAAREMDRSAAWVEVLARAAAAVGVRAQADAAVAGRPTVEPRRDQRGPEASQHEAQTLQGGLLVPAPGGHIDVDAHQTLRYRQVLPPVVTSSQ